MIKSGIYKVPSTNERTFCYEVAAPDHISIWYEEPDGKPQDHWWDQEITPQKFHWLVDEWNAGHIAALYPGCGQRHINSLLQLSRAELMNVFNYFAYVLPHYRWTTDLHLHDDLRPVWCKGKIVRFEFVTREDADRHNEQGRKAYRSDRYLYGQTDTEYIERCLVNS